MTSDELSYLQAERKKLRTIYSALFEEVSAILFQADPIGINFVDNIGEYDAEAGTILPRLGTARSAEAGGSRPKPPRDKYTTVAASIWAAYLRAENRPG